MSFGKRLAAARKVKNISQSELAKLSGIHKNVLGRYEREEANPAIDTAVKLADVLEVSLDFLTGKIEMEIDTSIVDRVLSIQRLPEKDKNHILFALDAMIRDSKSRFAYS